MAASRLDYTITQRPRPTQSHKVLSLKVVNTKTNRPKRGFLKSVGPCIYVAVCLQIVVDESQIDLFQQARDSAFSVRAS